MRLCIYVVCGMLVGFVVTKGFVYTAFWFVSHYASKQNINVLIQEQTIASTGILFGVFMSAIGAIIGYILATKKSTTTE